MKKNILKVSLVAAFALFAGYNVYSSQKSDVISDLALANVEALAQHWESESWKEGYESSSYQIYLPPIPGLTNGGYTTIPCCRYTNNKYSACSSIDICP